jgi:hypothetical protein
MAFARPFAYNTGSTISGTVQVGNLAVGTPTAGFVSTGLKWWNGPDEELGYVIAHETPSGQPGADGDTAYLGFWRSSDLTESTFIALSEWVSNGTQTFASGNDANSWLNSNGYWSSWEFVNGILTNTSGFAPITGRTITSLSSSTFTISGETPYVPVTLGNSNNFYHGEIEIGDSFTIDLSGSPYYLIAIQKNNTVFSQTPLWYTNSLTYTFTGTSLTTSDVLRISVGGNTYEYETVGLGSSAIQACSAYPSFGVNKYSTLAWSTWTEEMYIFNDSSLSSPYTSAYIANLQSGGGAVLWKQTDSNGEVISQGTCP